MTSSARPLPIVVRLTGPWRRHRVADVVAGLACFAIVDAAAPRLFDQGGPNLLVVGLASWGLAAMVLVAVLVAATLDLPVGPRLSAVIRHQSTHLRHATSWAAGLNLLLLVSAVVDLAVDSAELPQVVLRCALVVTSVAGLLAMGRLGWFFSSIRRVSAVDGTAPAGHPEP